MIAEGEKRNYEYNWQGNASHYASQGCYEWIVAQLDTLKPKKVFDVGCGTGVGLLTLRKRFACQILSIDENRYCFRATAALLRSAGAKVQLRERFHYLDQPGKRHIIGVEKEPIAMSREVMLLQGDPLLADTEMFRFVESKAPFDAVTIWLIGAYRARGSCVNIDGFNITDPGEYRCHVQNKIYELAARILRPGGFIQVVDRGVLPEKSSQREELLADHRAQASVTDLQVFHLDSRPYEELTGGRGVNVARIGDPSGPNQKGFKWGMISVLSRKPE